MRQPGPLKIANRAYRNDALEWPVMRPEAGNLNDVGFIRRWTMFCRAMLCPLDGLPEGCNLARPREQRTLMLI